VKWVADESVDKPIVDAIRAHGHEVYYILEQNSGISDNQVLSIANKKSSILITADKDFGEIVFRQKMHHFGVVLIRLAGLSVDQKILLTLSAIDRHHEEIKNHFSVISKTHIRIIKL
jgi:predicted nuclease of predicted toxin-antitoxin system